MLSCIDDVKLSYKEISVKSFLLSFTFSPKGCWSKWALFKEGKRFNLTDSKFFLLSFHLQRSLGLKSCIISSLGIIASASLSAESPIWQTSLWREVVCFEICTEILDWECNLGWWTIIYQERASFLSIFMMLLRCQGNSSSVV